jgi:crotonobetainyl-CoA:carnitine CoA-transferase CaiB-like acyl-CoA transferase
MHLDMSQLEASLHFSAPLVIDYANNGIEPRRRGNRDPGAAPHGVYPCQGDDRWIAIACFTDAAWHALRQVIAPTGDGWAYQEAFASLLGRKAAEDQLDERMAAWTSTWDAKTLMDTLQHAGVPAGTVHDTRDLFEDPQLQHRGHFQYLEHAEIGRYASERSEFTLSRTPGKLDRPAPLIGEHTEYVLRQLIGLTEQEYASFKDDAVLE